MNPQQFDWIEASAEPAPPPLLVVGAWVRPSYYPDVYQIAEIFGPCNCPGYGMDQRISSDLHYHLLVADRAGIAGWLNGYNEAGRCVWRLDYLEAVPADQVPPIKKGKRYA